MIGEVGEMCPQKYAHQSSLLAWTEGKVEWTGVMVVRTDWRVAVKVAWIVGWKEWKCAWSVEIAAWTEGMVGWIEVSAVWTEVMTAWRETVDWNVETGWREEITGWTDQTGWIDPITGWTDQEWIDQTGLTDQEWIGQRLGWIDQI